MSLLATIAKARERRRRAAASGPWSPSGEHAREIRRVPPATTHPEAMERWRARRREIVRATLAPPPRLTVLEWAERHLQLPSDNSSVAGQWQASEVPYLREVLESITDPAVERIVALKSAQVGFTVSVIMAVIGYYVDVDPSPIMVMQPTLDDAARFSKKKLMPIVRVTPRLRDKIREARPGDSRNTIHSKSGPGWSIEMVGAQSPRQVRSDSIRILVADERSGYARDAGGEGDPFGLAVKRTTTFDNRKLIEFSTPTVKPDPTEADYEDSDQRVYEVRCPHCKLFQELKFENLRWDKETRPDGTKLHHYETAHFVCSAVDLGGCGAVIEESDKRAMVEGGRWTPRNPGHPTRGYFIWQAYSLFPKAKWRFIAQEWAEAVAADRGGNPEKLKIVLNTVLGRSYEERGERPDVDALEARREPYLVEVPAGVAVLTGAIDVQEGWIEVAIYGWGAGEEAWLIAHHRIYGDTGDSTSEVWRTADAILFRTYRHAGGQDLRVLRIAVDSGDQTDVVYDYVLPRQSLGVLAVKGDRRRAKPVLLRPGKAKKQGINLFVVGVDIAKARLFSRLRIARPTPSPAPMPPTPGYIHFPVVSPDATGGDASFLKQFGNEKLVLRKGRSGEVVRTFLKTGPNEAVDLYVYALAALYIAGDDLRFRLGAIADALLGPRAVARMQEADRPADAALALASESTTVAARPLPDPAAPAASPALAPAAPAPVAAAAPSPQPAPRPPAATPPPVGPTTNAQAVVGGRRVLRTNLGVGRRR